jgi:hypothetical protein
MGKDRHDVQRAPVTFGNIEMRRPERHDRLRTVD